jgi:hypothetical protein
MLPAKPPEISGGLLFLAHIQSNTIVLHILTLIRARANVRS